MADKDNKEKFAGREPDYVRALRETRANMPKILDRETGVERDVFSPVPPEKKLIGKPGDALLERLGRKPAPEAIKKPKITAVQMYTTPAWLAEALQTAGLSKLDLGSLDTLAKLMDVVAAHDKRHGISFLVDSKSGELTVYTTGVEPVLSKEEMVKVTRNVKELYSILLPESGVKPDVVEVKEVEVQNFVADENTVSSVFKDEKSPAKGKKASTKKSTKKESTTKKATAPAKKKKGAK